MINCLLVVGRKANIYLGTDECSQGSNPQSYSMHPWVADMGSPLDFITSWDIVLSLKFENEFDPYDM